MLFEVAADVAAAGVVVADVAVAGVDAAGADIASLGRPHICCLDDDKTALADVVATAGVFDGAAGIAPVVDADAVVGGTASAAVDAEAAVGSAASDVVDARAVSEAVASAVVDAEAAVDV